MVPDMRKLYRSQRDKKIFGLCGGLAEMINVDSTLIRLVVVITAFFSGGAVIPIYFLAALVIPKEPTFGDPYGSIGGHGYGHGPNGMGYGAGYGMNCGHHGGPSAYGPSVSNHTAGSAGKPLDDMMKDIEKKALWNEIQELKAKLAKYEKGDN